MAKINPAQIPQHEDSYHLDCVLPTDMAKKPYPNTLRGEKCDITDYPSEKGMKATHANYGK